jgi:outer membrane protein OmpA-like peptidoglycan-associated protein
VGLTKKADGTVTLMGATLKDVQSKTAIPALEDIRQAFYSGTFQQTLGAFAKGSSTLTNDHKARLKEIAAQKPRARRISLVGANDNSGDAEANATLSLERAEAAKKYLVGEGVEASSVTAEGIGVAARMLNPAGKEVPANRRVDIRLDYGETNPKRGTFGDLTDIRPLREQDPRLTIDEVSRAHRLRLPQPSARERGELWRRALGDDVAADLIELASRYGMNGGGITEVMRSARIFATLRAATTVGDDAVPVGEDIARALRLRPAVRLEALAARREARARVDDLVLPRQSLAQLDELAERVRHRDRVFEEWGFAARVGHRQTSVLSLFTGPSGTGKTLAAEVVAARLGLDLYCIDLAQVVSKYFGETEKNLSRVFDAAEGTAAVLFFDEADGIFGKRTETRDAHDRYANLEISYLLARLETFTGLAIMASNLRQNIDAAFLRRMDYVVEFPAPDTSARVALWQRHLRCDAPIDNDVNARELADLLPVTGAHIRNAAVGGAFFAAADGGPLTRRHLVAAMRREYEKLGKSFPTVAG